jgi:predicted Zn-dependent protease
MARVAPASRSTPGAGRRFWTHPALWSALAAVLLYLPTLRFGFVWDDHDLIEYNRLLSAPGGLAQLLLSDFWAGSDLHTGFWRPLISLSYWLDIRLFGGAAWGFHAMNVAMHAAAAALVAVVVEQAGISTLGALLAGLWFAVLPAHVEPVAFVSGRTDVYAAVFLLLAFLLDRLARRAGRGWPGWGALTMFGLALLAKEASVAFLPLLALAEWVGTGRHGEPRRGRLRWLAAPAALCAVYLAIHIALVPPGAATAGIDPATSHRVAWGTWLEFPGHLAFLWPWANHAPGPVIRLPGSATEPAVLWNIAFQAVFVLGLAVLIARRAVAAVPVAMVWLPFLPLTLVGLAQGHLLFAERFTYLPSVGVAWLLALGFDAVRRSKLGGTPVPAWPGRVAAAVLSVLIGVGAVQAARSIPAWTDDRAIFGGMVAGHPANPAGRVAWARLLVAEGRVDEAEQEVRAARSLDDRLPLTDVVDAWIAVRRGRWEDALRLADRALVADSTLREGALARGKALMELKRYPEAGAEFGRLAVQDPDNPGVQRHWGRYLLLQGRASEALAQLERAAQDREASRDPEVHYELGMARAQMDQMPGAREAFARAVGLDPNHYDAWLRLALASVALGDPAGYEAALAHAMALPQAADGRVELLRRQVAAAAQSKPAPPHPR